MEAIEQGSFAVSIVEKAVGIRRIAVRRPAMRGRYKVSAKIGAGRRAA